MESTFLSTKPGTDKATKPNSTLSSPKKRTREPEVDTGKIEHGDDDGECRAVKRPRLDRPAVDNLVLEFETKGKGTDGRDGLLEWKSETNSSLSTPKHPAMKDDRDELPASQTKSTERIVEYREPFPHYRPFPSGAQISQGQNIDSPPAAGKRTCTNDGSASPSSSDARAPRHLPNLKHTSLKHESKKGRKKRRNKGVIDRVRTRDGKGSGGRIWDCRDGVLENCPPDCGGRRHREDLNKVKRRRKAGNDRWATGYLFRT